MAGGDLSGRPRVRSLEAGFDALHAYIRPKPEELRWMEIPWETDLWAARRKSLEAGKPIFLWAMNGHPLGCV